jgi:hypothetical protein
MKWCQERSRAVVKMVNEFMDSVRCGKCVYLQLLSSKKKVSAPYTYFTHPLNYMASHGKVMNSVNLLVYY